VTGKLRWEPACSIQAMADRAELNANIRRFFADRQVMEVETPSLGSCSVTDPALHTFKTSFHLPGQHNGQPMFLQTSPEFAMKRLIAAGSGSIYQICKAFRNEESGRHHNPEFTLLEWYRVGFTLDDLIGEVELLVAEISPEGFVLHPPESLTYVDAFLGLLGIHPLDATLDELADIAVARNIPEAKELCGDDRSIWLDLLFSYFVQPFLGQDRLTSVYRYPAFMPSLARTCPDDERFVERVEIFLSGMELGNGFHELINAEEQKARFQRDRKQRKAHGLPVPDMDERLLAALRQGLPDCSGMAIGLDRLLMAFTRRHSLSEVLAFPLGQS
jgi:lysyl-tRNA synthetase class 2